MSLANLNKKELKKLADAADVELDGSETNKQIVEKLEANNVSFDFYLKTVVDGGDNTEDDQEPEVADQPLFDKSDVLIKMERKNPTYQTFGVTFTREHPYAVVSEELAQKIIDTEDGFRMASPSEVKSFYS